MKNRNLDEEENRNRWTIDAMGMYGGAFVRTLAQAFQQADQRNFEKLKNAFFDLWDHFEKVGMELEKQQ